MLFISVHVVFVSQSIHCYFQVFAQVRGFFRPLSAWGGRSGPSRNVGRASQPLWCYTPSCPSPFKEVREIASHSLQTGPWNLLLLMLLDSPLFPDHLLSLSIAVWLRFLSFPTSLLCIPTSNENDCPALLDGISFTWHPAAPASPDSQRESVHRL